MKTLTKILGTISVAAVLVTTASAGDLNLIKGLNAGIEKGLIDKQEVNVVSVSKSFNYLTVKADLSNKTYRDYSVSLNLYSFKPENSGTIGVSSVYGYETFNSRSYTTEKGEWDNSTNSATNTKVAQDTKRHQIYIGINGTYIVDENLNLYNEIDIGTKAITLKLGLQHCFTNHISAGAEISKRWSYDNDYDNTNNVLFNISYTF